jgi:two-component system nitrogen regulation response regulator NtrX
MAIQTTSRLRGVSSSQPIPGGESPNDVRLALLYLPTAVRDRIVVRDRLARAGASVSVATDLSEALQMLAVRRFGLVIVDLAGESSAVATIRVLRAQHPAIPLAGVMDPADLTGAAKALSAGATDLLPWPFEDRDVQGVLASARDGIGVENPEAAAFADDSLFVHSPAMRLTAESVRAASVRKAGMVLVGEPGSGRTIAARTRHALDNEYVTRPFVRIDCEASGGPDLERRIFGSTEASPGSPAAAAESVSRAGAIVSAQGGTLFFTNLIEAPARVQARLAGILRDREAFSTDVGEVIPLDIRVMAAVAPDIDAAVADGRMRKDLFERLAQVRIEVPPLRRRREDLPLLSAMFLRRACQQERCAAKRFSRGALALLAALPWRGNAAELGAAITAIVRSSRHPVIQIEDVLDHVNLDRASDPVDHTLNLRDARAQFEREYISRELIRHHGRVGDAARTLGMQRTNLYRKVRQLKISKTLLSSQK